VSPSFPSVMLGGGGGRKYQCVFDQKCCIYLNNSRFYETTFLHSRLVLVGLLAQDTDKHGIVAYNLFNLFQFWTTILLFLKLA
jgi:hypothetical protein